MLKFLKKGNKINLFIYYLITGVGIVVFWRGIWGLLDIYLFPNNPELSYLLSAVGGLLILFINDRSISEIGR